MPKKSAAKKTILSVVGLVLLVVGISCILVWWSDLVTVIRGVFGLIVAVAGLFILYTLKNQ